MNPLRAGLASLAGVLLAASQAFAQAPTPSQPPLHEPVRIFDFVFPGEYEGAKRISFRDYEKANPGLGFSVGYQKGQMTATIFVFDMGEKAIPDDVGGPLIKEQLQYGIAEVEQLQRRGQFSKVELKDTFSVTESTGEKRLSCVWFTYFRTGSPDLFDSVLCLGASRNKFVKFRASIPQTPTTLPEAVTFITSWASVFWPRS